MGPAVSVANLDQRESVRGCAKRRFASWKLRLLVEEARQIIESKISLSRLDCSPGEQPDHFVEESLPGEGEEVSLRDGAKRSFTEGAMEIGSLGLVATVGGKGTEIVSAKETGEGVFQGLRVKLAGEMPDPAGLERRKDRSYTELVAVSLGPG